MPNGHGVTNQNYFISYTETPDFRYTSRESNTYVLHIFDTPQSGRSRLVFSQSNSFTVINRTKATTKTCISDTSTSLSTSKKYRAGIYRL